jgi:palmitoyltransferase ZDHHC2/15/20
MDSSSNTTPVGSPPIDSIVRTRSSSSSPSSSSSSSSAAAALNAKSNKARDVAGRTISPQHSQRSSNQSNNNNRNNNSNNNHNQYGSNNNNSSYSTSPEQQHKRITKVDLVSHSTQSAVYKPQTPSKMNNNAKNETTAIPKWSAPDEGAFTNIFASNACRILRAFGSVMVLIVLGIIGLTYYATVALVYGPLSEEGTDQEKQVAKTVLIVYHVMIFMILWSYFAIVLAEPGSVPERWTPPEEDPEMNVPKSESKRRVCKKCVAWKPERTHHCSVCQRCVLRMDHHCVWVANCVGARNYKFFLQFLVYTFIGTTFDAIFLLSDFVQFFKDVEDSETNDNVTQQERDELRQHGGAMTIIFVAFILNVAFAASLLGFIVMHGNLVLANMTTIEMYEKKKTLPWKYDKGRWGNFKEIFGNNVFSWLLPFHTPRASEIIDKNAGLTEGHIALASQYCRPIIP